MGRDLWSSNRDKNLECRYWSQDRDPRYTKENELTYRDKPNGTFMAKESNSYLEEVYVVAESIMFRKNTITLEVTDDISDLRQNDIVEVEDTYYRVVSVQKQPNKNQRQNMLGNYSCVYFVSLRR